MATKTKTVKVGDSVKWRGCFGMDAPRTAVVEAMTVSEHPRCKYGEEVDEVDVDLIRQNRVVFDLDNGHWAYSEQIEPY